MDNSMMNSTSKAIPPKARTVDSSNDEESSWTSYFEDFLFNNNEHGSSSSGYDESQSLVSDAASSVPKKFVSNDDDHKVEGFCLDIKRSSNLNFKKRKTKGTLQVDDALEDTASSPVNSPKEKGGTSGQREERSETGIDGRDSDCTELKKRGLCLVPLSMLPNYLG